MQAGRTTVRVVVSAQGALPRLFETPTHACPYRGCASRLAQQQSFVCIHEGRVAATCVNDLAD